jgi:membrane-associated protease RseP (regulator of RpoE activity)
MLEALGALVEDIDLGADGVIRPVPSWRTNIAKRRVELGLRTEWGTLFDLPRDRFLGVRPNAQYAQVRAIGLYMHERGALGAWAARSLETGAADALAQALGEPIDDAEAAFVAWLRDLPESPESIGPGEATLGVELARGRGDGARIDRIEPGAPAREAGLRTGDVLVRVAGLRVWTPEDLARVLARFEPGETVDVAVRRYARRVAASVTLGEAR